MSPQSHLEGLILRGYRLIREYEGIIQRSQDPREKERATHEITEVWKLVRGYLREYFQVCQELNLPASQSVTEIAVISEASVYSSGMENLDLEVNRQIKDHRKASTSDPPGEVAPQANQPGSPTPSLLMKNNPWTSGLFYLIVFLSVLGSIVVARIYLRGYELVAAVIVALLTVSIVGALQLRNDDRLADASFLTLVIEVFKQFPLLGASSASDTNSKRENKK
jgi:hypothetical protein